MPKEKVKQEMKKMPQRKAVSYAYGPRQTERYTGQKKGKK